MRVRFVDVWNVHNMKYAYKGQRVSGQAIEGFLKADDVDAAHYELMRRGILPEVIDVSEEVDRDVESYFNEWFPQKIATEELIMFCRQMAALTRSGVTLIHALSGLSESILNQRFSDILKAIAHNVENAKPLAEALADFPEIFSPVFIALINVGENTGNLDAAFKQLAHHLTFESQTNRRIKQATRYPTMVMSAIGVALTVVNVFIIPAFSKVFVQFGSDLPIATQILMGTSSFTINYWWLVLSVLFGLGVWFKKYTNTEEGLVRWDKSKLNWPILGPIFTKIILARFSRVFSMLYSAGVPLLQALVNVAQAMGNAYMAEKVLAMRDEIELGDSLTRTAKNSGIFSPLVLQMVTVGEETGNIDEMLMEVADFYEEEVDYGVKKIGDAVEPILLVAMGLMVLILALGVFLPMWDLGGAAQGR